MKSICTGKLSNGTKVEIVEADTFSGRTEFAVLVAGEAASISVVSVIRNGDVVVKTSPRSVRVKAANQTPGAAAPAPNLSDVKE